MKDIFKDMNPKTKRAVTVLSIIALLILIVGLVSCSIQLSRQDNPPPMVEASVSPTLSPENELITDIDHGGGTLEPGTGFNKTEQPADDTTDTDKDGKPTGKPSTPGKKPATPPPANPPAPTPTTPTPKPTEPTPKLTTPVKPTEPPKPADPAKPPVKPDRPSSGGSVSYPAAVVEIIAPGYSHADTEFEVKTVQRNVKSLTWTVSEDGKDTSQGDFLKGMLDKNGGKITITQPGNYTITAIATNYGNRTYTFSKAVTIHPILEIKVETSQYAHTDTSFEVKTTLSDNVKQQLNWHIYQDGKEVKWADTVIGTITNTGGTIQIKEKGSYTLKATAYDDTSREFSGEADVAVLPVVEIRVTAPKTVHTDTPAHISTATKELGDLSIHWGAAKDGKEVVLTDCDDGTLADAGGSIQFKEKGVYVLTAAVTDRSGRVFTGTAEIKVYPVAAFSFDVPTTTHTDTPVTITVQSSELQDMAAEWTVLYNGKIIPPPAVLEGRLTNEGGAIRFLEKGSYTLKATMFDETGREYSHEASTVVYPVAEAGFYLPPQTHTDTVVEVKTSFLETDGQTAEWSLTKNGKVLSLADGFDGTLTNEGGKIRFLSVGSYELKATVTDKTGRSFSYTAPCTVYPVITLSMELTKETHTDREAAASLKLTDAGTLPVVWSMEKNNIPTQPEHALSHEGGTIRFAEKGAYTVTASVTDEAGRNFATSQPIKVYPVPNIVIDLPAAVHTDDTVAASTTLTNMEGLTAVWYVDNTYGFQDWETYIEGKLGNNGGSIRFIRAGIYDLQARVTDATGRVFRFNSEKIEVLPVLNLIFDLPVTGHTDTQIDVRTRGNNNVLPVEWELLKNGKPVPVTEAISGLLNAQGGKIRFTSAGEYRLTATMFDALGRVFSHSEKISVYPLYNCAFSMPSTIHAGQNFVVAMGSDANLGGKTVVWTNTKDSQNIAVSGAFVGGLTNSGGTVHMDVPGKYKLTATITDELGRVFSHEQTITVTNTAPTKPTLTASVTRTYSSGKFLVNLSAKSTDPDGDSITYEYEGKASDNYYALGSYTVRVRAKDNYGGVSDWTAVSFTVANSAPTQPSITASVTRNQQGGKFLVNLSVNSTDPDGDAITYEYEGKVADNYYPVGSHTVRVRAKDAYGGVSPWAQTSFMITNSAPTRPEITRTPGGNSITPGTPVTITARSTDADGDPITYVWEGRPTETAVYALGKHTIRVKAVDSTGAESPWAAIVFFVMDSNGSGGMMLTGPDSTINENGIDGATITNYTFTVPPVSGHNGNDYGRVRGYNVKTRAWDQLDYGTTSNGITFSRNLTPSVYSKLEFYYYTNHNCMYEKSNITYTVAYYFE